MKTHNPHTQKHGVHLSKELRKTYGKRSVGIRKGDRVVVIKGKFKKKSGKIERVDTKRGRVMIDKIKVKKPDGSERYFPVAISNIVVTDLEMSDQRRKIIFDRTGAKPEKKESKTEKRKGD